MQDEKPLQPNHHRSESRSLGQKGPRTRSQLLSDSQNKKDFYLNVGSCDTPLQSVSFDPDSHRESLITSVTWAGNVRQPKSQYSL